jgi:4-hydroxyphenylpyruvate dioxygenase
MLEAKQIPFYSSLLPITYYPLAITYYLLPITYYPLPKMKFHHVHFYVENAQTLSDWFSHNLGFKKIATNADDRAYTEILKSGEIYFIFSSPLTHKNPVADWLNNHPSGVADVAFLVDNLELTLEQAILAGAKIEQPLQEVSGSFKWAKIRGWGDLTHTLIEHNLVTNDSPLLPLITNDSPLPLIRGEDVIDVLSCILKINFVLYPDYQLPITNSPNYFTKIDHVVLNVAKGDLSQAVNWYKNTFNLQPSQSFSIQTDISGLSSIVMVSPDHNVQLPINEPVSPNSQIQEFLEFNRGAGIQHIALQTNDIIEVVGKTRFSFAEASRSRVSFLSVPPVYYHQLRQKWEHLFSPEQWQLLEKYQILLDRKSDGDEGFLLQIFTQPIFDKPTFFLEFIERRINRKNGKIAQGFGEGNFRALFDAIEREQLKRDRGK